HIASIYQSHTLYNPVFLDFRGRTYTSSNLCPEGPDLGRALLLFDHAEPLTASGLVKMAIANFYGLNKLTIDER
ncbi:hypothetical protein DFS34DRAFT_561712, partial [Phlyctochytrium arcticum]